VRTARSEYLGRVYENRGLLSLVDLVDQGHHSVLDVGCGNGANMCLLAQRGHRVVGITLSEAEAHLVASQGFECHVADIAEAEPPFPAQSFDALLFSHVLEHLAWPETVLRRYGRVLRPGGGVYVALPNVLHIVLRWQFLRGRFRYTEMGLMDRTHLRFFDFDSARKLVEQAGFEVVVHRGVGQCPMGPARKLLPESCSAVDRWCSRLWPHLFAIHILIAARRA